MNEIFPIDIMRSLSIYIAFCLVIMAFLYATRYFYHRSKPAGCICKECQKISNKLQDTERRITQAESSAKQGSRPLTYNLNKITQNERKMQESRCIM